MIAGITSCQAYRVLLDYCAVLSGMRCQDSNLFDRGATVAALVERIALL